MFQTLLKAGAQDTYNRVGMQLFIARLKPNLNFELMKWNPANMREAFNVIIDAKKICAEPKRGIQILAVESTEGESDAKNDAENHYNNIEEGE